MALPRAVPLKVKHMKVSPADPGLRASFNFRALRPVEPSAEVPGLTRDSIEVGLVKSIVLLSGGSWRS